MTLFKVPELTDFQWQQPVTNRITNAPPGSPAKGDRYIIGSSPSGAWASYALYIATYNGSTWDFTTPIVGMNCYVTAESLYYSYTGSTWVNPFVKTDGTANPTNIIFNGDFHNWSSGVNTNPDGWYLNGAGASISQEATIIKVGLYSAKITRAGTDCYLQDTFYNTAPIYVKGVNYWRGRKVTLGCWVYATVANRAYITCGDGISSSSSNYHTGDSTWQWITVTRTIDASATSLTFLLRVANGNTSAYFAGVMAVDGDSSFAFSPTPKELCVARDGTVNLANILYNGNFEDWNAGTSSSPDAWVLSGASATVAREASIVKIGTYSSKVTRAGTDCKIYQDFTSPNGKNYWYTRKITFGCWIYATVANSARIGIDDYYDYTAYSAYHPGDSTWKWISVDLTINYVPDNYLRVMCLVLNNNTSAYFDGAMLVEGDSTFAFSDKPASEGAWVDYSSVSTIVGWTTFTSKYIYIKKIGKLVFVTFLIVGTSNATTTSFTVPYTSEANIYGGGVMLYAKDNGAAKTTACGIALPNESAIVSLYTDMALTGAWTNSGIKQITGQFFYEATS